MLRFRDEPSPAPAPAPTDSLLSGGSPAPAPAQNLPTLPEGAFLLKDFKTALPEELRKHEGLGKINTLEDMTRSYIAAQRMIGRDPTSLTELPKADAKLEERLAVLGKLGAPEKADGYKLALPEGSPEVIGQALALDTPLGKAFLDTAVKLKMLPEQVQGIYGMLASHLGQAATEMAGKTEADHAANIAALKTEAGPAFDDWIKAATFGISKLGGDPLRDVLNAAGLGTNPLVVKALMTAGKMMAEDNVGGQGGTGGRFGTLAPAEARARAKELVGKALSETNPSEKKRLQEEAQKFFRMATGEKALTSL